MDTIYSRGMTLKSGKELTGSDVREVLMAIKIQKGKDVTDWQDVPHKQITDEMYLEICEEVLDIIEGSDEVDATLKVLKAHRII